MVPGEKKETEAWIGLGSNVGDGVALLRRAARKLLDLPGNSMLAASSLYRTAPLGDGFSGDFINAVLGLRTRMSPLEMLIECQRIEAELGRNRLCSRDRTVDLDILLVEDLILTEPPLILPHPRMAERRFVLEPMTEVAPDLLHPFYRRTMKQLLDSLGKGQRVERLEEKLF